jgi:hypothetical protein
MWIAQTIGIDALVRLTGSSLSSEEGGERCPLPPAHLRSPTGASPEGLVRCGSNRGPEAQRFGVPSWVPMGRRDAGDG